MEGELTRVWKRARKKYGRDAQEEIAGSIRHVIVKHFPIPNEMAEEIAEYYLEQEIDYCLVEKLDEIQELMNDRWLPEESALGGDDWDFLKDLINDWALEIDMELVNRIMKIVVEKGGFSGSLR